MFNQIRKNQTAINIFIDQFGVISQIKSALQKHLSENHDLNDTEEQLRYLPDIIFPTLKITIEKLLKNKINVDEAIEEMNAKLDIIAYGFKRDSALLS